MQSYKCPNCGRIYNYSELPSNVLINCMNCRYPLKRAEEVKNVKHPELNSHNIIGTIKDPIKIEVKCPYCKSTNTSKISTTSKVINTAIFGIFGTKRHKQWHCNECRSDF